jgi:signal transduction histidine kinase
MEPLAVKPLIDEAWSLLAIDEKTSGVEFANLVRAEDRIIGNSDRLAQVFVNLLRNALNAVEVPSGRIDVRSRRQERGGKSWVTIAIEDNGRGIPPDVLPDIFDAFVTTRLDARGTGLGLTVAEGIVTQHGGMIAASNRPEGGACLEVSLPAADS